MILHFLTDDKFSDYVIKQFSGPEMCSEFVLMTYSKQSQMQYFKTVEGVQVVVVNDQKAIDALIKSLSRYSAIVMHGLFDPWCETVLRNVPDSVKVAWVFWGGEIYGRKDLKETFLSNRSKWLYRIHNFINRIKGKTSNIYELPIDLFQRIDYCLTDVHEDFEFVQKYCGTSMKELWYNYYSIDETIGKLSSQTICGNNILVGNSCSIECNHIDGIIKAKTICNKDTQVVVPLSYGSPWLRIVLLKFGRLMLKDHFQPLTDFMPRDVYNKIIAKCSTVIMPHYRPQAFGNVLTNIWMGAKVYMSEKNHLYHFFKRIGVNVFSIETDFKNNEQNTLSNIEVKNNRIIIDSLYSKTSMKKKLVRMIEVLTDNSSL